MATDVVNFQRQPHAGSALDQRDRLGTPANGAAAWGKVQQINGPDGSWERFEYDAETGWVTAEITPFQNSDERRTAYTYDTAEMGGALAMRTALTERPRSATTSVQGQTVSKTLYQRASGNGQIAGRTVSRQLANDGSNNTPDTGEVRSVAFQNNGTLETAYTFGRDIFGRLSSVERTAGGTQTVGYNYNANGQLQSERQPWAGSGILSAVYGYYGSGATSGPAGALQSVRLSNGLTDLTSQTYTYNAKTQRLETVASAGVTHTYEYRPNTDLVASLSSSNNITAGYQYEPNTGRLQSISWYPSGHPHPLNKTKHPGAEVFHAGAI